MYNNMEIKCPNCGAIQILSSEKVCCYCKYPVRESDKTNSEN